MLPNIVVSILAMLLIGGVIGTVAWSMFSGTNSVQRQDNAQPAANQVLNVDNPFEDPAVIVRPRQQQPIAVRQAPNRVLNVPHTDNPFADPALWKTDNRKTDNPFAD